MLIVEREWELLNRDSLLPDSGCPKHLLWALHFMKVYPKQSPGCLAVGASAGAVSPKTHRKWVWAFIDGVANLVDIEVSNYSVRTGAGVMFCIMLLVNLGAMTAPAARRRAFICRHQRLPILQMSFFPII